MLPLQSMRSLRWACEGVEMMGMVASVNRKGRTVGEKWGDRHPLGAAAAFFALWIVALVVLTGVFNPILVNSFSDNPASLRLALEVESLATVVIPATVCPFALGRFGCDASELRRSAGKGMGPASEEIAYRDRGESVGFRFAFDSVFRHVGAFVGGLLGGALWFALAFGALAALGVATLGVPADVLALPVWIVACAINATFQEILVRGYAFDAISRGGGVVAATVITTLVFIAFHPGAFVCGPIAVLQIAAASVLLTVVRIVTGSLAAPIAMHAAWNALGGIGFGAVMLANDYPSVFGATLGGPAWISGGAMGLEGSVVTLAVTVVLCFAVALFAHMRSNRRGQ